MAMESGDATAFASYALMMMSTPSASSPSHMRVICHTRMRVYFDYTDAVKILLVWMNIVRTMTQHYLI